MSTRLTEETTACLRHSAALASKEVDRRSCKRVRAKIEARHVYSPQSRLYEETTMRRSISRGILLCLLPLMCTAWVMASPTGSITGFVKDSTGALVPGVKVILTNIGTNAQLSTNSNENGGFQFPQLAPARYSLVVESPGFKRTVINALVQVDQITRVDVVLEVGDIV